MFDLFELDCQLVSWIIRLVGRFDSFHFILYHFNRIINYFTSYVSKLFAFANGLLSVDGVYECVLQRPPIADHMDMAFSLLALPILPSDFIAFEI